MNINEKDINKLKAMLNSYKAQHGAVSVESCQTSNCGSCSGICSNFCTNSCNTYCDGNSGMCWKLRYR